MITMLSAKHWLIWPTRLEIIMVSEDHIHWLSSSLVIKDRETVSMPLTTIYIVMPIEAFNHAHSVIHETSIIMLLHINKFKF
jgi:hypothetical protein